MSFQTVFFHTGTKEILNVLQNRYIKGSREKLFFCPGYKTQDVALFYFMSTIPVDPSIHKVVVIGTAQPPFLVDQAGIPLLYFAAKEPFMQAIQSYRTIVLDFQDSMGDNLYRAACALEAQKVYPNINFLCKVEEQYKPIISLVPGLTLFKDYASHNLLAKNCATITMSAKLLPDPLGDYYSAPSRYGLYLGLNHVPYDLKLDLPSNLDKQCDTFLSHYNIADIEKLFVFQLRTKDDEGRSWSKDYINSLADLVKQEHDCTIFYLGAPADLPAPTSDIVNLSGKTSWLESLCLLTKASKVFCVDSSVLHLCHSIGVSPIALYGRTDPRGVLGSTPTRFDLGVSDTDRRSPSDKIKPLEVLKAAFGSAPAVSVDGALQVFDHSQHGERKIIFDYFSSRPAKYKFVVDIGAYGADMSNSFDLLSQGWQGFLFEANSKRIPIIEREFAGLNFKLQNIGISDRIMKKRFYKHSVPGHYSLDPDWALDTKMQTSKMIDTTPLADALIRLKLPLDFDFLSIDTENLDFSIMTAFLTTSKYRPSLICTESSSYPDAVGFFKSFGYSKLAFTGAIGFGNFIFERD